MNRLTNRRRSDGTLLDRRHGIHRLCDGSSWHCITKWDTLSWFEHTRLTWYHRVANQFFWLGTYFWVWITFCRVRHNVRLIIITSGSIILFVIFLNYNILPNYCCSLGNSHHSRACMHGCLTSHACVWSGVHGWYLNGDDDDDVFDFLVFYFFYFSLIRIHLFSNSVFFGINSLFLILHSPFQPWEKYGREEEEQSSLRFNWQSE